MIGRTDPLQLRDAASGQDKERVERGGLVQFRQTRQRSVRTEFLPGEFGNTTRQEVGSHFRCGAGIELKKRKYLRIGWNLPIRNYSEYIEIKRSSRMSRNIRRSLFFKRLQRRCPFQKLGERKRNVEDRIGMYKLVDRGLQEDHRRKSGRQQTCGS